ncbi:hypothetical protein IGI04_042977 [Brassica rapa subsp. trilocularis]|uniref:Chromo domain-containing protein n=1 Tax=Brassica rapa subsp. trilocularis TaxID=1813537 RepID=A0ABQ7KJJ4_BRACM|nr:hypothetical protein IGI04_042977 [Brassica rapa subsp. trilocularis]
MKLSPPSIQSRRAYPVQLALRRPGPVYSHPVHSFYSSFTALGCTMTIDAEEDEGVSLEHKALLEALTRRMSTMMETRLGTFREELDAQSSEPRREPRQNRRTQARPDEDVLAIPEGPITRSKSKQLKQAIGGLLMIAWKQEEGLEGSWINQDTLTTIQAISFST